MVLHSYMCYRNNHNEDGGLVHTFKYYVGIALLVLSLLVFIKLWTAYLFVSGLLGAIALWRLPGRIKLLCFCMAFLSVALIVLLQLSSGSHFIPCHYLFGSF